MQPHGGKEQGQQEKSASLQERIQVPNPRILCHYSRPIFESLPNVICSQDVSRTRQFETPLDRQVQRYRQLYRGYSKLPDQGLYTVPLNSASFVWLVQKF